jgi:regulator of cell morphogenesis and NO signaling
MMELEKKTLSELVNENPHAASIFEAYGLDFCCKGNQTLEAATIGNQQLASQVREALEQLPSEPLGRRYHQWDLSFLIDYIVSNHHQYIRSALPSMKEHLDKVIRAHGEHHPELYMVSKEFNSALAELSAHLEKEELVLFPYIKRLLSAEQNGYPISKASFASIANPIGVMISEHEHAGRAFETIRELLNDYEPPADACTTMRLTYRELDEFEKDLHMHVFLENSILFPKALKLERTLTEQQSVSV